MESSILESTYEVLGFRKLPSPVMVLYAKA